MGAYQKLTISFVATDSISSGMGVMLKSSLIRTQEESFLASRRVTSTKTVSLVLEEDDVEVLVAGIAGVDFADLARGEEPVPALPKGDDREVDEQEYAYPHPKPSYILLCIHFSALPFSTTTETSGTMDMLERSRGAAAVVWVVIVVVIVLYQAEDSGYGVEGLCGEDVAIGGSCCEVGSRCRSIGGAGD